MKYDADIVAQAISGRDINPEEGVDGSFELECTINDQVKTGQWVGDCFLYTNGSGKLHYFVGGEVMTLCHLNSTVYLLGFVPKEDRVFLIDKAYNVLSYKLLLSVLNYQTAVVRRDFDTANAILPSIPKSEHNAVARFLESQGFKEEALGVSSDPDHRFELAIDLKNLSVAHQVLSSESSDEAEGIDNSSKWRRLGDLALSSGDVKLAQSCAIRSGDLSGLLLLYAAAGNKEGMKELAVLAKESGRTNVAFLAFYVTAQVEECIDLLIDTNRLPEAAFMARTYLPSRVSDVLKLWKADLKLVNEKAADALADPATYPNLFPDLEWALKIEAMFLENRDKFVPATEYMNAKQQIDLDLIELVKSQAQGIASISGQQEAASEVVEEQKTTTADESTDDSNKQQEEAAVVVEKEDTPVAATDADAAAASDATKPIEVKDNTDSTQNEADAADDIDIDGIDLGGDDDVNGNEDGDDDLLLDNEGEDWGN